MHTPPIICEQRISLLSPWRQRRENSQLGLDARRYKLVLLVSLLPALIHGASTDLRVRGESLTVHNQTGSLFIV